MYLSIYLPSYLSSICHLSIYHLFVCLSTCLSNFLSIIYLSSINHLSSIYHLSMRLIYLCHLSVCIYLLSIPSTFQTSHMSPAPHMRNIYIYFEGTHFFLQSLFQKADLFLFTESFPERFAVYSDFMPCLPYAGAEVPTSALGCMLRGHRAECVEGVGGPCVRTLGWLGAQVSGHLSGEQAVRPHCSWEKAPRSILGALRSLCDWSLFLPLSQHLSKNLSGSGTSIPYCPFSDTCPVSLDKKSIEESCHVV